MAAGIAADAGKNTVLLERNSRVGRKLLITGKGRCNLTNACEIPELIAHIPSNGRFLYSAFHHFSSQDTICFFEEQGVPTKIERGNRVFPQSDKAVDVVDAMYRFVKKSGCKLLHGRAKSLIIEENSIKGVVTEAVSYTHLMEIKRIPFTIFYSRGKVLKTRCAPVRLSQMNLIIRLAFPALWNWIRISAISFPF